MAEGTAFEKINVGNEQTFSKTITEADIVNFAGISGDFNPLHINAEYAKKGVFGERVAHGILTLALISTTLAGFPGDVVYLSQTAKFLKPVKIGDTITAVSKVKEKGEKSTLVLNTSCRNQKDEVVMEGEAKVKIFESKL